MIHLRTVTKQCHVFGCIPQLGCNHIGDEGVKALALALLSNAHESQLVWLGLGGNEITDRGAEHLAVALKAQHSTNGHFNYEEGTVFYLVLASSPGHSQHFIVAHKMRERVWE